MKYSEWYTKEDHKKELMKSSFFSFMNNRERLKKCLDEFYFGITLEPEKTLGELKSQSLFLCHSMDKFLDFLNEYEHISNEKFSVLDFQDLIREWKYRGG